MSTVIEDLVEDHVHRKFQVVIMYNGIDKRIDVDPNETVKALLERAIQAFGPLQNPHLLALFTMDGQELKDEQRIKEAGVKPDDHLLLRPSAVKGG